VNADHPALVRLVGRFARVRFLFASDRWRPETCCFAVAWVKQNRSAHGKAGGFPHQIARTLCIGGVRRGAGRCLLMGCRRQSGLRCSTVTGAIGLSVVVRSASDYLVVQRCRS